MSENRILSIIRTSKLNGPFHRLSIQQRKVAVSLIKAGTDYERAIERAKELCK